MLSKNKIFSPSLLLTQTYYPYCDQKGSSAEILKKVTKDHFYEAVEIDCHYESAERKEIYQVVKEHDLVVTQWLTSLIDRENLDLSSLDNELRKQSVKRITDRLDFAAESGVNNIAFISGPNPGELLRKDALESFYESLHEICAVADTYQMGVLIEPLDHDAHKRKVLGVTDEAVDLINRIRKEYKNLDFAFDTAHVMLNRESLSEAITKALPIMGQIHFSNAVLDLNHELYGDHHIAIGEPGFLNQEMMNQLLQEIANQKKHIQNGKIRVAIEARGNEGQALHENEIIARRLLEKGFQSVKY